MSDLINNIFRPLGPDKGFGVLIMTANVFFYGSYQFWDAFEDSTANPFPGNLPEPTLYQIEPG